MSKETTAIEKFYTILMPLSKRNSENWKFKCYYPFLVFRISEGPFLTSGLVVSLFISTHLTCRKSVKPVGISSVSNERFCLKQAFPEIRFPIKKSTKTSGNSSQISNSSFGNLQIRPGTCRLDWLPEQSQALKITLQETLWVLWESLPNYLNKPYSYWNPHLLLNTLIIQSRTSFSSDLRWTNLSPLQ